MVGLGSQPASESAVLVTPAYRHTRLRSIPTRGVYSGLGLYGFPQAEDQARFGALYERCRATASVEYVGPVPQPELARRLRRAAMLAYPNTVPEGLSHQHSSLSGQLG